MSGEKPQTIQDVHPAPASAQGNLIEVEIQHNIPIKTPGQHKELNSNNPIATPKQFADGDADQNDAELDHILKDATQKVEVPDDQKRSRFSFLFHKKTAAKKTKAPETVKKPKKPVLAILIALLVVSALSVAAYYAFKQAKNTTSGAKTSSTSGRVGTSASASDSIQTAGGKLVQPGDITSFSSSLQSQINGLNDSQDFNQTPISDQSLGL